MMQTKPKSNWRFMMWWMVGTYAGFIVGAFIGAIFLALPALYIESYVSNVSESVQASPVFSTQLEVVRFFVLSVAGAALGLWVGWLQLRLIHLHRPFTARRWLKVSIIGMGIGGLAIGLISIGLNLTAESRTLFANQYITREWPKYWPLTIWTCGSALQFLSLRREFRWAGLWIVAHIIIGHIPPTQRFPYDEPLTVLNNWIITATVYGALTGGTLLYLFRITPLQEKRKVDDAEA